MLRHTHTHLHCGMEQVGWGTREVEDGEINNRRCFWTSDWKEKSKYNQGGCCLITKVLPKDFFLLHVWG